MNRPRSLPVRLNLAIPFWLSLSKPSLSFPPEEKKPFDRLRANGVSMPIRQAVLPAILLLGGCGGTETVISDPHDERIECRIGNARQFERFCTVEAGESEQGRMLTVRKPDGGFRRLLVTDDGRGVAAADGAETARVTIIADDRIEVSIAGDTFRLPATVQGR